MTSATITLTGNLESEVLRFMKKKQYSSLEEVFVEAVENLIDEDDFDEAAKKVVLYPMSDDEISEEDKREIQELKKKDKSYFINI